MAGFSKNEVILVRYPFSDLTAVKVRPAVIVGKLDGSPDYLIVPRSRAEPAIWLQANLRWLIGGLPV
jgi:mRNA interferase MazF